MPKVPTIDKIADDSRFTRTEAEELNQDLETWRQNAETLQDRLNALTDLDLDDMIEKLADLEFGEAFESLGEHLEGLKTAAEKAEEIKAQLDALTGIDYESPHETWADDGNDKEDRAAAREELVEAAAEIRDAKAELDRLGVDIELEY